MVCRKSDLQLLFVWYIYERGRKILLHRNSDSLVFKLFGGEGQGLALKGGTNAK